MPPPRMAMVLNNQDAPLVGSKECGKVNSEQRPLDMASVVLKKPGVVVIERRPVPIIQDPKDIIVKIQFGGLCGSDLHPYRGIEDYGSDFIMGHEFTGSVFEVGSAVTGFHLGDVVVSPFTTTCGNCWYCTHNLSSRCMHAMLYGTPKLGGGQAQYVRVPNADATAFKAPDTLLPRNLILMADIFPTGFYCAKNGFFGLSGEDVSNSTVVVVGCGPVGLCAIAAAATWRPKHLVAIDGVPSRLENATSLGADSRNFKTDKDGLVQHVHYITDGRGADVVLELVGVKSALELAYELARPGAMISSIGVHNTEFPFTATQGYDKNLRLQMGRCPVRSVFPEALECLKDCQSKLGFLTDTIVPLSNAVDWYKRFDRMEVQKVIFDADK